MPDYSREKAAWLAYLAGEPREAYRRLNANGTLTYEFVSDSGGRGSLSLRFPLAAFAHLCGFEYYKDEHKGRRAPQERFFHDLPSSGFNPARVDYTHRVGHPPVPFAKRRENTRRKIAVAAIAFGRMEQASHVVESAKSTLAIFVGESDWALGVRKATNGRGEELEYYVPVSLLDIGVLAPSVCRKGRAYRIVAAWWR